MIEKGKKYTYEELKEIIKKAKTTTTEKLSEEFEEQAGNDVDVMGKLAFTMQNMLATHKMAKILLGEDK